MGVFDRIFANLARQPGAPGRLIIDSTRIGQRPAFSKRAVPKCLGRTKGGLNSKLHAAASQDGKILILRRVR
jgi:hypothetical protein